MNQFFLLLYMDDRYFCISNVKIADFKSLLNVDIDFCDNLNLLIGHNGSGKSNLLEVLNIYLENE